MSILKSPGYKFEPHTFDELCALFHDSLAYDIEKWQKRRQSTSVFIALGIIVVMISFAVNRTWLLWPGIGTCLIALLFFASNRITARIEKLGVVGLPFQEYRLRSGTIVIDRSGMINPVAFKYPSLPPETIVRIGSQKEELVQLLSRMPLVLTPTGIQSDVHGKEELEILNLMRRIASSYGESRSFEESLRLVPVADSLIKSLKVVQTDACLLPLKPSLSDAEIQRRLGGIEGIGSTRQSGTALVVDIDDLSVELAALLDKLLPLYQQTVDFSLREVNYKYSRLHDEQVSDIAFNHYCPHCNAGQIAFIREGKFIFKANAENQFRLAKGSRMRLVDPVARIWKCPICDKLAATPFAVHKLDDQLFKPVFERLEEENRVERLRIYNTISDQKRSYAEKAEVQMQQVMREERAKADMIKSKLRTINADISADQMAIAQMAIILQRYEQMGKERAREYERDIESIKAAILQRTEEQQRRLESQYARMKAEMNSRLELHKDLERIEDRKKFDMQKQLLESVDLMKNIDVARAERESLPYRSNWPSSN